MSNTEELREKFGESEQGNFYVEDTIGVPHPFCIGEKVMRAVESGLLSKENIMAAESERHRGLCSARFESGGSCQMKFEEHEQAILVGCKANIKGKDDMANPELHQWLLKNKELCEKEGFAGFSFLDKREKHD